MAVVGWTFFQVTNLSLMSRAKSQWKIAIEEIHPAQSAEQPFEANINVDKPEVRIVLGGIVDKQLQVIDAHKLVA